MRTKTVKASSEKVNAYSIVTDKIIAALEAGTIPWRKTWSTISGGSPVNHVSGRAYRGINWFLLRCLPYECSRYVTFKQALEAGGNVRKGEKSALVTFWKLLDIDGDGDGGKVKKFPFLRYYNVFNLEQCEGIDIPGVENIVRTEHERIEAAEAIVSGWSSRPAITHKGGRAFYSPAIDVVTMPEMNRFTTAPDYYATLFHELAHATGHKSRLGRITETATFGDDIYAQEELVAEMTAAFLCAACGIDSPVMENQAAYLQGWVKVLRGDSKLAIVAASQAAKAADFILGTVAASVADEPEAIPAAAPVVTEPVAQLSLF